MGILSNKFEKIWFSVFAFLYLLIMLPLPWQYSETYSPGFFGVPIFLYTWLAHGLMTILLTVIFARRCMSRSEYVNFELVEPFYPPENEESPQNPDLKLCQN